MKERKFRSKLSFQDDEEEEGPGIVLPGAKSSKSTDKKKAGKKSGLLSFGGEEHGGKPSAKAKERPSHSKFNRAPSLPDIGVAPSTQRPSVGEYTAERLVALQKNAISYSSNQKGQELQQPEAPAGVIKLTGTFKKDGLPKDDRCAQRIRTPLLFNTIWFIKILTARV